MTLPISIRKKNEQYDANVKNRGNVKKSLDPKREEQIRQEEQQKKEQEAAQATGENVNPVASPKPRLSQTQKTAVYAILALFVSSILFQFLEPFLLNNSRAPVKARSKSNLKKKFNSKAAKARKAARAARASLRSASSAAAAAAAASASSASSETESLKPLV